MSKKLNHIGLKFLLWCGAIMLLTLIITQLALWFGLQWLNSDKGEAWAKHHIDVALKDTDYSVDYTGFRYRPLTNLMVENLSLSNSEGEIFTANNTKVGIDIVSLALRDLSLNFVSDRVVLHRLPAPEENDVEKPKSFYLEGVSLPNVFFDKFNISKIAINALEIAEPVFGRALKLSPLLKGKININEDQKIDFDLDLHPDVNTISAISLLPKNMKIDGQFDAAKAYIDLKNLSIASPSYTISGKGEASLNQGGHIHITAAASSDDLSKINGQIDGTFKSKFTLSGTQESFALTADGVAAMPLLKQRGLQPITFDVKTNYAINDGGLKPTTVKISSAYKNIPVALMGLIEQQDTLIVAKNITATAPDIKLNGDVTYDLNRKIANGKIISSIEKLSTYKDLTTLDIAGKVKSIIDLSGANDTQTARINLNANDLRYQNITLNAATISAKFLGLNYYPFDAAWTLSGLDAQGVLINTSSGSIKKIGTKTQDTYALTTKGVGQYNVPFSFDANAGVSGIRTNAPKASNINSIIKYNNQPFKIAGTIDAKNIDILIKTDTVSLSNFTKNLPDPLEKSRLSGHAKITGAMAAPIIMSDLSLSAFNLSQKTPAIKVDLIAGYQNNAASINFNGSGKGIRTLSGKAQTPIKLSFNPFIFDLPAAQTLNGKATLNLDVQSLANMVLPPQNTLSGMFQSDISLGGTIKNPTVQGDMNLKNGTFADENLGIFLNNINAQGILRNDFLTLNTLTANDDKNGTITASGRVGLNAFAPQDVNMALTINDFHLLDGPLADGVFDADLNLSGTPARYKLDGSIRPDYINISIPEKLTTNIPELNIVVVDDDDTLADNILEKISLNVNFIGDNKIFVRGWELDAEFGGRLKIDGNLDDPNFEGVLKSSRGRYTEFSKRFELARANLNFLGRIPANPVMDIVAETNVDDITAQINIKGAIKDPKITFSSNPTLPEDEVLARILFGRDLSSISPFQAVQLAQTIRRFSGKGGKGFDPLGKIRDATGFDDLRVDTNDDGETTVGAGKYLSDQVYLEFEKGTGNDSGAANLEVELTPNITLESQIGQDAKAGAGIFWEWDY